MRFALGLGSNVGDRLQHMRHAARELGEIGQVVAVSRLYETEPVGGPEQGRFLNAVVLLDSHLDPEEILAEAHRIEAGRDRTREVRWGPRTLDIDVLVADGATRDSATLALPHPRVSERRFAVAPLAEVWPDADVGGGLTASAALRRLSGQRVFRWSGDWVSGTPGLGIRAKAWVSAQLVLMVAWLWLALVTGSPSPNGWVVLGGGAVALAGGIQGLSALRLLGSELSAYPQAREGTTLIAVGPYKLVRHPIYGAIILGAAGIAILQESWIAAAGVLPLLAFFWAKSSVEERSMLLVFPDYEAFRRQVRRRLIPWLV